jgi:hypothetical protein
VDEGTVVEVVEGVEVDVGEIEGGGVVFAGAALKPQPAAAAASAITANKVPFGISYLLDQPLRSNPTSTVICAL